MTVAERIFAERMRRARIEGRCVGAKASNVTLDCSRTPVVMVHHPAFVGWPPDPKCQYHLDVLLEFGPRPERIVPLPKKERT